MSDSQLIVFGAAISLVTTVVTVIGGEWFRARNNRTHDQERFERERSERREQFEAERAERHEDRLRERQRHTLEGLQVELAIVRQGLIWYRNTASSLESADPDVLQTEKKWLEWQQTLSDANGELMTLDSRVDDEELRESVRKLNAAYSELWEKPPTSDQADLAQQALEYSRSVRLRSGKLLQPL